MSNFLIALLVPLILGILFAAAGRAKPIKTEDGGYLLEYARALKGFGVGFTLITLGGLAFLLFKVPIKDVGDFHAIVFLFCFFALFAIYFYIEFFTVKIWVGPSGIRGMSGWRGKREYAWNEISEITYSPLSMWFKVSSPASSPLRIHAMITGTDKLRDYYTRYLPKEKWSSAEEKFTQDRKVNK